MKQLVAVVIALAVTAAGSAASAQAIVYETYSPVVTAPVVVQSPVIYESWRPAAVTTYSPPVSSPGFTNYTPTYGYGAVTSYYAPVTTYSPVTAYSPVVTETVTAYSPVVTTTYSPVVTTYSPVVTAPVVTTLIVRPRYVPGQPVRNFFRAMGP